MNYKISDEIYQKINSKIEQGIFTKGKNCSLKKIWPVGTKLKDIPIDKRTPEICYSQISDYNWRFSDVPESARTREFFISAFTNTYVFNYIKENIDKYDRQFFKDLIESNEYCTFLDKNCFAIMPVEYIDEEMCSLAILNSLNYTNSAWFYFVYQRKPEALTADLWKLGARLYSRISDNGENRFLEITPTEYKDSDYYLQMCRTNFNCGIELPNSKGKIMKNVPDDVLDSQFVTQLLSENINNIAKFDERGLELKILNPNNNAIKQPVWKLILQFNRDTIRYIPLNEERGKFFLEYYGESPEKCDWIFRSEYSQYKQEIDKNKPKFFTKK